MMSTTGRSPVIAAPTPRPVIPASEIGESSTRSGPNSSTRPASTLNGVPASATSSPRMNTARVARELLLEGGVDRLCERQLEHNGGRRRR